jgi:hypothetical protein
LQEKKPYHITCKHLLSVRVFSLFLHVRNMVLNIRLFVAVPHLDLVQGRGQQQDTYSSTGTRTTIILLKVVPITFVSDQ